jgi:hypothetical protein
VRETADAVDVWIDEVDELPFDIGVLRKFNRAIVRRQRLLLGH